MKKVLIIEILAVIGGFIFLAGKPLYIVKETDQCFITQFGRPIGKSVTTPGIHFKMPFIQKTHFFSRQFLEWDGNPEEVTTKDKKFISIDTYARWRILDPLLFFQQVTDEDGAQTRLDDFLDGATRSEVAANNLVEIIRSHKRDLEGVSAEISKEMLALQPFTNGRGNISNAILKAAEPSLKELGIELLDIKFKRIMYGPKVQSEIFNRMIAERQRIADEFRSEGQGEAQQIDGERERELKTIQSEAYRKAQEIKGAADAAAINIYAGAYNKDSESQEFYKFLKTMETYETSFTERDSLILSTDTELYRFLGGSK
jgi:membrane protease subunit HflC